MWWDRGLAQSQEVWLLLWPCGQLRSPAWAGWSAQRTARRGWQGVKTNTGRWHHGRWGTAAALARPRRSPRGHQLRCPRVLPWCPGSASQSWPRTGKWPAGSQLPCRALCLPSGRCSEPGCSRLPDDPTPGTPPLRCPPAWGALHSRWSGLPHPAAEAGSLKTD